MGTPDGIKAVWTLSCQLTTQDDLRPAVSWKTDLGTLQWSFITGSFYHSFCQDHTQDEVCAEHSHLGWTWSGEVSWFWFYSLREIPDHRVKTGSEESHWETLLAGSQDSLYLLKVKRKGLQGLLQCRLAKKSQITQMCTDTSQFSMTKVVQKC